MRIALSGRAYSGKSTLAAALAAYDFAIVNYSRFIKTAASRALLVATGVEVTPEYIEAHKKDYRAFLQTFAEVGGFNAGGGVKMALHALCDLGDDQCSTTALPTNIVFDNVRTQAQIDILADYGFVLVTLDTSDETRWERAKALGVGERDYSEAMYHPTEKNIPIGDVRLNGKETSYMLANTLATLAMTSYHGSIVS